MSTMSEITWRDERSGESVLTYRDIEPRTVEGVTEKLVGYLGDQSGRESEVWEGEDVAALSLDWFRETADETTGRVALRAFAWNAAEGWERVPYLDLSTTEEE